MTNLLKFSTQRLGSLLSNIFSNNHTNYLAKDVTLVIDTYLTNLAHEIKHRGAKETLSLYKQLHLIAVKIAMGREFVPLPFRKSSKAGVPRLLNPVLHLLRGSPNDKRMGLTITKLYVSVICAPSEDFSSITEPFKGKLLGHRWHKFLSKWCKKFKSPSLEWDGTWRPTNKAGPNGHALIFSHVDAIALLQDPTVLRNLLKWCLLTDIQLYYEICKQLEQYSKVSYKARTLTGRLGLIPEGGGKTRQIAIPDYFTQISLQSLFKALMGYLRTLETDGTYEQGRIAKKMQSASQSLSPIYCYDLSSATDRFPVQVQEDVLSQIIGKTESQAWVNLLTMRYYDFKGQGVKYSTGQPMGVLSSWAAFALTHHAVIEYAAHLLGHKTFREYVVLGDDVAIFDTRVANLYVKILAQLGVLISQPKSFTWRYGDPYLPSGEVAKRLFLGGREITPIPYDLIASFLKNPSYEAIALKIGLDNISIRLSDTAWENLSNSIVKRQQRKKFLTIALAPDFLLDLSGQSYDWTYKSCWKPTRLESNAGVNRVIVSPWDGLDLRPHRRLLIELLIKQFTNRKEEAWKLSFRSRFPDFWTKHFTTLESPLSLTELGIGSSNDCIANHPLQLVINQRIEVLSELVERLGGSTQEIEDVSVSWDEVYDADWNIENTYVPKRDHLSHKQTSMLLTLKELLPKVYEPVWKSDPDNVLLLEPIKPTMEPSQAPEPVKSIETGWLQNPFGQWMWDWSRGPKPE